MELTREELLLIDSALVAKINKLVDRPHDDYPAHHLAALDALLHRVQKELDPYEERFVGR